jgi:ribosome-binding protein aMBF1 (putative translation factor)
LKHLEGKLWEMRMKGRDGIARSLYVTAAGRRVIVLRTFVKRDPEDAATGAPPGTRTSEGVRMNRTSIPLKEAIAQWREDPEYVAAYDSLEKEFTLSAEIIGARAKAGLSQAELAERMATSQSAIARLESGRVRPSVRTLERLAAATGTRLRISLI